MTIKNKKCIFGSYLVLLLFIGCGKKVAAPIPQPVSGEWKSETLYEGLIHHSFSGYYEPTKYNQIINVLELDIENPDYDLSFNFIARDSLSSFVKKVPNAIAAINGTYGEAINGHPVSFIKTNNIVKRRVTLPADDLRFYKHEGAFYYESASRITGIEYGNGMLYNSWSYPNIISGAPVLIDNFEPVGETFVKPNDAIGSLPNEHPDKMQAVRHPRTAIAITEQGKLLFITVDGRRSQAGGMSAKELTQFLKSKFNPKYALNLDGGGSTTMWIEKSNLSTTGVVNFPTDAGGFSHYGQRALNNCIVITKK